MLDQEYLDRLEVRLDNIFAEFNPYTNCSKDIVVMKNCLFFSQLDTALIDAYEYMQKYAVGLEQIVWDQEDLQLEFRNQFEQTEYKLRTVSNRFLSS